MVLSAALRTAKQHSSEWNHRLAEVTEQSDIEQVVGSYLRYKAALAAEFGRMARADLDPSALNATLTTLQDFMSESLGGLIQDDYLRLRGYGEVHQYLFSYLSERPGFFVSLHRLRVITDDATHTERRLRDLRDLGLTLVSARSNSEDGYRLSDMSIDLASGALAQLRRNLQPPRFAAIRTQHLALAARRLGLQS